MNGESAYRILYIEDDLGLARLIQKRLERLGHAVDLAPNGRDGIAELEKNGYDLLIVDYNMPIMDGLKVIEHIKEKQIPTPVVMLTGAGDERVAVEAMKSGASDYLVKDVDAGYLLLFPAVIQRVMREKELLEREKKWHLEREQLILELQDALAHVKTLGGLLPICAGCKKIRDDTGYWRQVEDYIGAHTQAEFSHSLCPDCVVRYYPELNSEDPLEGNSSEQ
ncbi:MAG: response regulator [Candidatus Hydrogenedentes bacterium]|nr:response regulator [Candidatus Hydrogenedentota bacterium]